MADADTTPGQGVLALDSSALKRCSACGQDKSPADFYKRGRRCKPCCIADARASRTRRKAADPEGFRARAAAEMRARYAVPEERARIRARAKAARAADPEKMRAQDKARYARGGKARQERWRAANRERSNEIARESRNRNPERARARMRDWRVGNHQAELAARRARYAEDDRELKRAAAWREANPEKVRAQARAYALAHPAKVRAWNLARATAVKQRTPQWLNAAHFVEMDGYYEFCRIFAETGPWEVDHLFPVKGRQVSGLHVPWNLQILSMPDNVRKNNKMPAMTEVAPYIECGSLLLREDGTAELRFTEG